MDSDPGAVGRCSIPFQAVDPVLFPQPVVPVDPAAVGVAFPGAALSPPGLPPVVPLPWLVARELALSALPLVAGDPPVIGPVIIEARAVPPAAVGGAGAPVRLPPGLVAVVPFPFGDAVVLGLSPDGEGRRGEDCKSEFHRFFCFVFNYKSGIRAGIYRGRFEMPVIFLVTNRFYFYLSCIIETLGKIQTLSDQKT